MDEKYENLFDDNKGELKFTKDNVERLINNFKKENDIDEYQLVSDKEYYRKMKIKMNTYLFFAFQDVNTRRAEYLIWRVFEVLHDFIKKTYRPLTKDDLKELEEMRR